VIAVLTILGYSLYDTVVVFDKIKENVALPSNAKKTYGQIANESMNQVLMRSINTSLTTLLPVGSLLFHRQLPARRRHPARPGIGPLRRDRRWDLLVDLRCHAAAVDHEGAGAPLRRAPGCPAGPPGACRCPGPGEGFAAHAHPCGQGGRSQAIRAADRSGPGPPGHGARARA